MGPILDHTQDLTGTETHRLTSIYKPPEFVKVATHAQLYGEAVPSHLCADPQNGLYRCHHPAATWMSTLFFMDKVAGKTDPAYAARVEAALEKAAVAFHIKPEIDRLKSAMLADADNDIARLPDSDFAYVWRDDTGKKERHYTLRNANEVKTAADWFAKYRDEFVFADRQQMASKILDKADLLGVATEHRDMLEKTAGHGACPHINVVDMLEKRACLVARSHPEYAAQLRLMRDTVQAHPLDCRDHATRCKLAGVIDNFDRQTQLTRLYDAGGLDRPEELLFQVTEKVASAFTAAHVETMNGNIYERATLDSLGLDHVRAWMGDDFADAVSAGGLFVDAEKMASVVPTLPRNDAEMFDRMVRSAGQFPVMVAKAASDERLLTPEVLAGLAAEYQEQPVASSRQMASVLD